MPRPRRPSPESIKRIYTALLKEPKCFEDIWKETLLHRNTIGSTLKYLVNRGLLIRYRKGHKTMYEMVKTQPPYYGWEIPWIELMMTKRDWQLKWKRLDEEIRRHIWQKRWKNLLNQYCDWLINHPNNRELVKTLEEMGMLDVPILRFRENLGNPFCLECLRTKKQFVRTIFNKETKEFICPICGTVLENN